MSLLLRSLLLGLLAVAPVGAGQISMCELGSYFDLHPHHHDDMLKPHAVCMDTSESHHDKEPAPCSDDCALILFDTPPIRSISNAPITAPKILAVHTDWTDLHATASRQHVFMATEGLLDSRTLSCSPEQICRFLI